MENKGDGCGKWVWISGNTKTKQDKRPENEGEHTEKIYKTKDTSAKDPEVQSEWSE